MPLDESGALTPKLLHDENCALTWLEVALAKFWAEVLGSQPGAPDGDFQIGMIIYSFHQIIVIQKYMFTSFKLE